VATVTANHLYMTMRTAAKTTSVWVGETAVWGWRIAVRNNTTQLDKNTGTFDLESFDVDDASATLTSTHMDIDQAWAGHDSITNAIISDNNIETLCDLAWDYFNSVKAKLVSDWELESVRLYPINVQGVMATLAPIIATPITAIAGSGTGVSPTLAVVTSTDSATKGRSGRGRWYIGPWYAGGASTNQLISSTDADIVGNAGKALFDGIRDMTGTLGGEPRFTPVTWHRAVPGTASVIKEVRVGDEVDRQARRRRQRAETYTVYDLA
jgi:hypothetical protein